MSVEGKRETMEQGPRHREMLRVPNPDVNRTRRHKLNKSSPLVGSVSIFICLVLVLGSKGNGVVSNSQQSPAPNAPVQSSGPSSVMNYSRFKQRLDAGART